MSKVVAKRGGGRPELFTVYGCCFESQSSNSYSTSIPNYQPQKSIGTMSDSEDDFMSDKFLVEAPAAEKTYRAKRDASLLKGHRAGLANNKLSLKAREEQQRREGLNTSLFDKKDDPSTNASAGGGKAMAMMMKMGWKVGEGLGKKDDDSVEPSSSKRKQGDGEEEGSEDAVPKGGIGSSSRKAARTEPIRISLWSGRKGLSARDPTPPPVPTSNRNPDMLDERKMARLGQATDQFRDRQRMTYKEREDERKEAKARELLIGYDEEKGVRVSRTSRPGHARCVKLTGQFHPLHVMPSDALGTLPRPLLRLIYPAQVSSRSPSPTGSASPPPAVYDPTISRSENLSAAERLREQMRRDMLTQMGGEDEGDVRFGVKPKSETDDRPPTAAEDEQRKKESPEVDWESMVSGTKKVLTMDVSRGLPHFVILSTPLTESARHASHLPHLPVTPRTPVLLLVRVQVQVLRGDGGAGRMSRRGRRRSLNVMVMHAIQYRMVLIVQVVKV